MKKNLIVLQTNNKSCGAACLLSIIKYHKGNYPLNELEKMTSTTINGTNFYNISVAANRIGLSTKAYYLSKIEDINNLSPPLLCQTDNDGLLHFVVIYRISNKKVEIMDPSIGRLNLSIKDFIKIWTGNIMEFSPYRKLPNIKVPNYLNQVILKIIKSNKIFVINIIIFSIIFTAVSCIYAYYLEILIKYGINAKNLKVITLIFTIIITIKCLSNYIRNRLVIKLDQKIDCSLITKAFQKTLLLPYNYYKNKTTGDILSRINDLTYIKIMLNQIILTVLLDAIISISSGIILYNTSSKMFTILIIIILNYIVIFNIFKPLAKKRINLVQEQNSKVNSYLVESISGFETIKGLNLESNRYKIFQKKYNKLTKIVTETENLNNIELFLKEFITALGIIIINYIGFLMLQNNQIKLEKIITFNALLVYFINPIKNIIDLNKNYYYAINALKRANNIFEVETENLTKEDKISINGNIVIKNLSFNYPNKKVLNNLNLTITNNSKVLVLGSTGSGKSTLLKILCKYYKIKDNCITYGNHDLNKIPISNIRKEITYISQNEIIYTDTIKNNIILNRNINSKDFNEICKLTYVNDIVSELYLGYDTLIEENGANISGGQKQKIILARSLLKPSNILIIDEGLNEMDINLERRILKNIFNKYPNKTIIVTSHRTENMDLYNQVIKIEDGRIIENLKKKNYY